MTAGQHQAAAANEDQAAGGQVTESACAGSLTSNCQVSWRSTANPTVAQRDDAKKHHELADKHRAASQALRVAEQRSCSGVSTDDRDLSPFYHREDVTVAEALEPDAALSYDGGGEHSRPNGARVGFRAVPGLTAEWLQQIVDCHLARNAVVGASDSTMSYCPLAVPNVKATVTSNGRGFTVEITSDDAAGVKEIIKRAQALKPAV